MTDHTNPSSSPFPNEDDPHSSTRHSGERTTSPSRLSFNLGSTGTADRQQTRNGESRAKRHSSFSMSRKSTSGSSGSGSGSGSTSYCYSNNGSGSSKDTKRLSGTVHHRGRHANDWLFGGFSLRDQVSKLFRDDQQQEDRDRDGDGDGDGDVDVGVESEERGRR